MEKLKKLFSNKERKTENLIFFLILLIFTLIFINKILKNDNTNNNDFENQVGVELANESSSDDKNDLEERLEKILCKISGVGTVSVMITYSESSSVIPIYNTNLSTSTVEENDTSGGSRTTKTETNQKEVIKAADENIVTEKVEMPKIEGAIIIAEGASNTNTKANIISAVEAVTGIATHKIQVFEMNKQER